MRVLEVGGKRIGEGQRPFLVAEIGANHQGDLKLALEHIHAAAEAGADAVKFQSLRLDRLYLDPSEPIRELHRRIDLPEKWYPDLMDTARKAGVLFHSSPTYLEAVDLLEDLGVALYKLASAQVGTFPQIVERVAELGKPTFLSTGLSTAEGLQPVVDIFRRAGNDRFVILHCNSLYPTPPEVVHLPRMRDYAEAYGCLTGFSDHTPGIHISLAAAALGAHVIERHFILDRERNSPDAPVSLEPEEFRQLARGLQEIHLANRPQPRRELEPEEAAFQGRILYRLVLKRGKKAGEGFQREDFDYLRSPDGIDAREMDGVLSNSVAKVALAPGELLTEEKLERKP